MANSQQQLDMFYPASQTMLNAPQGMWQLGMAIKLSEHLAAAKLGDRDRESRLVNRLGQIRRCVEKPNISAVLADEMVKACRWLQSQGRKFNFKSDNPSEWISQRGGAPRW